MTRAELFEDCMPLVERAVRCLHIQGSGQDDARQAAYEALWLATGRCDPECTPLFRAYAKQVVFGAVKNWLVRESRHRGDPEPEELTARPADKAGEPSTSGDTEAELCNAIDGKRALIRLRALPAEQRNVVDATLLREMPVQAFANRARMPRARARRRFASAIASIRRDVARDALASTVRP